MKRVLKYLSWAVMLAVSLTSCDGILGWIYDDEVAEDTIVSDTSFQNVDATSYTQWVYLNLHTHTMETAQISTDEDSFGECEDPEEWDIALHRYDTKTNGGAVLETRFSRLDALVSSGEMPQGTFVEDIWTSDQISVDMSGMMTGEIGYAESWYNPELSKWVDVDISVMPPIYTPSNKVYLIRMADSSYAAVILTNYTNSIGDKGFLTIDYIYPFEI